MGRVANKHNSIESSGIARMIYIEYGDFSPNAKENMRPDLSGELWYGDTEYLREYNALFVNFGDPYSTYNTALDGRQTPIPKNANSFSGMGVQTAVRSGTEYDNGYYILQGEPIILDFRAVEGVYSSSKLTLKFDYYKNIFPTEILVSAIRGGITQASTEITNISSAEIVVDFGRPIIYDEIYIVFDRINMPENYLTISEIIYGAGTKFSSSELEKVKIIQGINPISVDIEANIADFNIRTNASLFIQKKQPFSIYKDEKLISRTFASNYKKIGKNLYTVETQDYIGIMEDIAFPGGIYFNRSAYLIFDEIFETAKIPADIDESLKNVFLSGYIPYTNCRTALQQVAFASRSIVDTSNSENVKVRIINDVVSSKIKLDRIYLGQKVEQEDEVTAVEVAGYIYNTPLESEPAEELYRVGEETGTIELRFTEPILAGTLEIEGDEITLEEAHPNYVIMTVTKGAGNSILKGKRYKKSEIIKRKTNANALSTDIPRIIKIQDATLVSSNNIDSVLEMCYNYYVNRNRITMKVAERKNVDSDVINAGDYIETETEFFGDMFGYVERQSYNLNKGITVKDITIGGARKKYDF